MKTKFTFLALMVAAFFFTKAQSYQIPNGTFDNWSTCAPVSWTTYEQIFACALSGFATRDTIDTIAPSMSSVKLVSDSVSIEPSVGVVGGIVSLGTGVQQGISAPQFIGIPFTYRPDTLWFDYKYSSPGSDTGTVYIMMWKDISVIINNFFALFSTNNWRATYVVLDQYYLNNSKPDSLLIQFNSSNVAPVKGSTLIVDNVRFSYINTPTTAITSVKTQNSVKVYPNPASNFINVVSNTDITGSNMLIYDITGRLVSQNKLEGSYNNINIANLANGNYIYKITDTQGGVISQNKLAIVR